MLALSRREELSLLGEVLDHPGRDAADDEGEETLNLCEGESRSMSAGCPLAPDKGRRRRTMKIHLHGPNGESELFERGQKVARLTPSHPFHRHLPSSTSRTQAIHRRLH